MKVAWRRDKPFSLANPANPTCAVIRISAGILKIVDAPEKNHKIRVLMSSASDCGEGNSESAIIPAINGRVRASKKKAARRRPFVYFLRGTFGTDALRDSGVAWPLTTESAPAFSSTGFFGAGFFLATGFFSTGISFFGFTTTSSAT